MSGWSKRCFSGRCGIDEPVDFGPLVSSTLQQLTVAPSGQDRLPLQGMSLPCTYLRHPLIVYPRFAFSRIDHCQKADSGEVIDGALQLA